eukprot:m.80605 g.80605  ORF g.80605 m.80605 type:complete len:294 (-) comp14554_c1_seq1:9-890(-)
MIQARLVCIAAVVSVVQAWGPLAHFATNCAGIGLGDSVKDCVCNTANNDLGIGSDAPDAFYFGGYTIGNGCDGLSYMHDALFGANMVKFAEDSSGDYGSFDALRFAQGYLGHTMGDAVGFNPSGMLTSPVVGAGNSAWIPLWQYMVTLDNVVFRNLSNQGCQVTDLPYKPLSDDGVRFLADATTYYHSINSDFAAVNSSVVRACTASWQLTYNLSILQATVLPEDASMALLQLYNRDPTASVMDILNTVVAQRACMADVIAFVLAKLKTETPEVAVQQANARVSQLYQDGKCL